jgi:AraC family transcriptional regulator of adaptative response/methylated-DNA-[protein]-cysteine methyltransferase
METTSLPPRAEMLRALGRRDGAYEGVFVIAVRTTGIFCRPGCPARCRPLEPSGGAPAWLRPLLEQVDAQPERRWRDGDLRALGLSPERVRRWFQRTHGMSFHGYSRSRRLGQALGRIQQGDPVTRVALDSGFDSLSGFGEAFGKLAGGSPTVRKDAPLVRLTRIATPLGPMVAGATADALCLLEFADRRMLPTQLDRVGRALGAVLVPGSNDLLAAASAELAEYFAGSRQAFSVPLRPAGTPFQERVWEELRRIPFGETASYAEVARRIGRPSAVRAVARANGDNRLAILIPCHRVIGASGALTGYGGGLWRTTLTIDEDLAARLKRESRNREVPFKLVVNEALRRGLDLMTRPDPRAEYKTVPFSVGECFFPDLDDIEGVLTRVEGDAHK